MRYTLRIIIIIFMGVSLTVLSFSNSLTFKSLDEAYVISPNSNDMKMTYNLYFVGDNSLEIENREIKIKDGKFLDGITEELSNGPRNKLLNSPLNYSGKIISAEIRKSTLFVNLKSDIQSEKFWNTDEVELYIWSLVNTYTEFEDVIRVQFLVEGKIVNKPIGKYNLNEPLMRNDSLTNNYSNNPASLVLEFVNYGMIGEYDQGYRLISAESRKLLDFKSFILFYDDYFGELSGYEEVFHYYQEADDQHQVYLKFSNMENENNIESIVKKFEVVMEGNRWYIDLLDTAYE